MTLLSSRFVIKTFQGVDVPRPALLSSALSPWFYIKEYARTDFIRKEFF